jgi:hypothetical protein
MCVRTGLADSWTLRGLPPTFQRFSSTCTCRSATGGAYYTQKETRRATSRIHTLYSNTPYGAHHHVVPSSNLLHPPILLLAKTNSTIQYDQRAPARMVCVCVFVCVCVRAHLYFTCTNCQRTHTHRDLRQMPTGNAINPHRTNTLTYCIQQTTIFKPKKSSPGGMCAHPLYGARPPPTPLPTPRAQAFQGTGRRYKCLSALWL